MKQVIICDLDGTLADATHRIHLTKGREKNWTKFFQECVNDKPIKDIILLLDLLRISMLADIILVSGRSDEVKTETIEWLKQNKIQYDHLLMRKHGDYRPDWKIKSEILEQQILGTLGYQKDDIKYILDDRDQVVNMWRSHGLRCLQVANGAF